MAEDAARLVENPLATIQLRQPTHKKVLALNSCSLCPESGTPPYPRWFAAGCSYSFPLLTNIRIISPTAQRTPSMCAACPSQRICQPYPHVIRQANDCLPESYSRNPLAAGSPQQETQTSFNRRAANLTRGGIKMKSIQTKFIVLILGCILLSSSMIGGAGILNAKHVVDEDSVKIMNLMCKEKKQGINALSRESSNRSRRWRSTSSSIPNLRRRHRACFEAK